MFTIDLFAIPRAVVAQSKAKNGARRKPALLHGRRQFTEAQPQWLGRIREHLTQNLSIDRDDFDTIRCYNVPADGERPIERSKASSRHCWSTSMRR